MNAVNIGSSCIKEEKESRKLEEVLPPLERDKVSCDDPDMKPLIFDLLNRYRSTCWQAGEQLGVYTGDEMQIKLKDKHILTVLMRNGDFRMVVELVHKN
ncbi:MAG: hypothetical protein AAF202_10220, partial [Pseudomonadota bacterium]